MKLSDRNNAAHFLMDDDPMRFSISKNSTETNEAMAFMLKQFPNMKHLFRQRIRYICRPFIDAYSKGKDKLIKMLLEQPVKQSGTFIIPVIGGLILIFFCQNIVYR